MAEAPKVFRKSFTHQEPISETAITRATEVLRSGKLHRYNVDSGETSEVSMLEAEFAAYMGMRYCLACASCGSAMYLALKSADVQPGDAILCNAFTLAPVPGMIENAGGRIILVEIGPGYMIDLHDLEEKAKRYRPKWLLLSHMRGHIADMDKVVSICREHGVQSHRGSRPHHGGPLGWTKKRISWPGELFQHADIQAHELGGGRAACDKRCSS